VPICDNCGTGLPIGYDYCFKCGYPVRGLPQGGESGGSAPPPAPSAQPYASKLSAEPYAAPPYAAGAAGYAAPAATARTEVLASWSVRFAAALVDYVLVSVVVGLIVFVGFSGKLGSSQDIIGKLGTASRPVLVLEVVMLVGLLVYNVVAETAFHTTIGKRLLSLRVVAYGGAPAGFGAILARNVTKLLSCFVWFVGVPVALIMIAGDPNRQRLGDRLAHTYVVRDVVTLSTPAPRR
jgi:uncharacterized RDD family membrane protein YckC